ncbi:MAG: hypothetical protein HQL25_08985, partial [Candidatus Omnitrophica bacterium]|nr:hypothetical protein [Candidatus Omnitrophota bacterium]
MFKRIFIAIGIFYVLTGAVLAGQVQLNTYYPAPLGTYLRMRLFPTTEAELPVPCLPGTLGVVETKI